MLMCSRGENASTMTDLLSSCQLRLAASNEQEGQPGNNSSRPLHVVVQVLLRKCFPILSGVAFKDAH